MTRLLHIACVFHICLLCGLSACGPATIKKAEKMNKAGLGSKQIVDTISDNTLVLTAYDFNGTVYFDSSGLISAVDNRNQRDIGRWDVNEKDQLCMRFRVWYFGDPRCYRVFNNEQADRLTFFTGNGAAYYTAKRELGDPEGLAEHIGTQSPARSVRKEFTVSQDQDEPSQEAAERLDDRPLAISASPADDADQTVKRLAGDCPGCNLAGVDLREASLIKANLQGADLSGADLRYANLRRANLKDANLSGARLTHANMPGADLSGADLSNCDLTGANLLLANFTDAVTTGAQFTSANLERTIGLETQK